MNSKPLSYTDFFDDTTLDVFNEKTVLTLIELEFNRILDMTTLVERLFDEKEPRKLAIRFGHTLYCATDEAGRMERRSEILGENCPIDMKGGSDEILRAIKNISDARLDSKINWVTPRENIIPNKKEVKAKQKSVADYMNEAADIVADVVALHKEYRQNKKEMEASRKPVVGEAIKFQLPSGEKIEGILSVFEPTTDKRFPGYYDAQVRVMGTTYDFKVDGVGQWRRDNTQTTTDSQRHQINARQFFYSQGSRSFGKSFAQEAEIKELERQGYRVHRAKFVDERAGTSEEKIGYIDGNFWKETKSIPTIKEEIALDALIKIKDYPKPHQIQSQHSGHFELTYQQALEHSIKEVRAIAAQAIKDLRR